MEQNSFCFRWHNDSYLSWYWQQLGERVH